jgi:cephalosporin hydroxylase
MGVPTLKCPLDMWNYQEILVALRPSLIIEFGSFRGGSALFFASVMRQIGAPFKVISIDLDTSRISEQALTDRDIQVLAMSSTDSRVRTALEAGRKSFAGPAFAILDSNHSKEHVLAEMLSLRGVLKAGDYLVVEDSNVNGHPVFHAFGPGPYEAIQEYFRCYPEDYSHDVQRERLFGFTFAPHGFLIRR